MSENEIFSENRYNLAKILTTDEKSRNNYI